MSQSVPIPNAITSVPISRQALEEGVDQLSELARQEIPPPQFLAEALRRILQLTSAGEVRFWQRDAEGQWRVSAQLPVTSKGTLAPSDADEEAWLTEAGKSGELSTRYLAVGHNGDIRQTARTICPVVHANQTVGLFDTLHPLVTRELSPDLAPFLRVVAEISADFLSLAELRQLRKARTEWMEWDQFGLALTRSPDLRHLAATIANDGRLLVGCDRVTVLQQVGSRFRTLAVTGVDRVDPRSNTVESIESAVRQVANANKPVWFEAASPEFELENVHVKAIKGHSDFTGARVVGILPLRADSAESDSVANLPSGVIVVEQFQDVPDTAGWRSRAELLANRSQPLLLSAIDRESIPFYKTLHGWRHFASRINRSRVQTVLLTAAVVAGLLTFIPAEFTVTGIAELVPDHRREVFASSSGIVDKLLVQHGDDVEASQPLVVLRDPQLDLELPKVIGEMDVVRERLKGVMAARLAGGATPDAANRARQLTSDEEELKERLQSLTRQRTLIEQQQAELTLRSPIKGKVLTWDVATLLSARPVERGHALLTVGDVNGPWVVEMRVADKDFGYVRRAQKKLKPDLDVDFLLASDPSVTYHGTIRDVSEATNLDDQLGISVLVTVAIKDGQIPNPYAGTTAIPRIRCGRQSIGYVWLHDLIDAIRTRLLF